ncbi:TPA: Gp49 family protein [Salmonella enterica]
MLKVEKRTIDALADSLTFHTHHFPGTTCTVAVAVLSDGFVAGVGKSACIDPAMFDSDIGYDVAIENARKDAINRLWEMEGYRLKQAEKQSAL